MSLPKHVAKPDPKRYLSNNYLVLDFETDGFATDPNAKIVLTGWKKHGGSYTRVWGDEWSLKPLFVALADVDYVVAQNAKFELQWLSRAGFDISQLVVADTMLAEYCILGNRRGPKDLSSLGKKYCGETKETLVSLLFKGDCLSSEIPSHWLERYNDQDVSITEKVWQAQRDALAASGLLPVFYTRCLTTVPLADIESRGLQLDKDRVKVKLEEYEKLHAGLKNKLVNFGEINWNSPKQVAELLYDKLGFSEPTDHRGEVSRTDAGGRKTDEAAISSLRATDKNQREFKRIFLDYRKAEKSLRDLRKMWQACTDDGGIIYGTLNQAVTQTHRLSATGGKYKLQFHNFDRDFKSLFRARDPSYNIGEADGKQLEFRVAVHIGNDPQGLEDVRNNFDVHRNTASVLFNKPLQEVTSDERTRAKSSTFKPLYGGQSGSPRERAYYKAFRKRYNRIYETQRGWTHEVLLNDKLRTATGLTFYWPGTTQGASGWISNTPSIFNYPVQSLATADIIPIAVVYLWHLMRMAGMKSFLINTIHDSVIAEIAPGEESQFVQMCRLAFTSHVFDYLKEVYEITFICPLGVESKIGSHWSQKEVRTDEYDLDPEKYFAPVTELLAVSVV